MSLYLYTEKLKDSFKNTNIDYNFVDFDPDYVVASYEDAKIYFKDYNEENLKIFVEKNTSCCVSDYFWNVNYCKNINISEKIIDKNLPYIDLSLYFAGKMSCYIGLMSIILELYNCKNYITFIKELNVDKNLVIDFLKEIDYTFPLTIKFLEFLKFIFDSSEIISYLFDNNTPKYDLIQTRLILENINFDYINQSSKYIFTSNISEGEKLLYIQILLEVYQNPIDITKKVMISNKKKTEYLGYYLLTFDITKELSNLYFEIIQLYIYKKGSIKYKIIDNDNLQLQFDKNENLINNFLKSNEF